MGLWEPLSDQDGFTTNLHRPVRRRGGKNPGTAFRQELRRLKTGLQACGEAGGTWSTFLQAAEREFDRMPETLKGLHGSAAGLVLAWAKDLRVNLQLHVTEDRFELVPNPGTGITPAPPRQPVGFQPMLFEDL